MTSKPKLPVHHRLIRDMSSEAYHGTAGTWSSSQLKSLIDDEELFIQNYVTKTQQKIVSEALDTGTYFHTGLLEPHKLSKEIAVFGGKVRFGAAWKAFKDRHEGKTIITEKQRTQGEGMISAVRASPSCMEYLKGEPEVSLFVELLVSGGEIYAPYYGKKITRDGWTRAAKVPSKGYKMSVKVRADCLGDHFISDLKSTSGKATKSDSIRGSISKYKYDLSASLYLDMFSLVRESVTDFIWIFASKENPIAASWRASRKNILVGRAKWAWAVKRLADLSEANWERVDFLREAEPLSHELEWLEQSETDLL